MPGRFKITGNNYVSEWGGNSLNPGTPESPYASIVDAPNTANLITVIGTGIYKHAWPAVTSGRQFLGDGKVEIDALGSNVSCAGQFKNLKIKNGASLTIASSSVLIEDCIIENFSIGIANWSPVLKRNIFKNVPITTMSGQIRNSILLDSFGGTPAWMFYGCYIPKGTIVTVSNAFNFASPTNNMINGLVSRAGILYECKLLADGSPRPDADPAYADFATLAPNFYTTQRNFAGDPKFLDLESKIVEPDSDLLKTTFDSLFVGAVRPGQLIRLDNPNFQFTYTRINTSNPLAVQVAAGQTDGEIRITGKISDTLVNSRYIGLRSIFEYFKGATGGTGENHDVPDAVKQLGLLASEIDKPRRLTYWMRTSLDPNANQASPASIWDNDGSGAGTWLLMEVNTEPRHVSGVGTIYGNGDPRGGGQVGSTFNFRSIDIRVVLDNDRD